jgi:hypothetical protein
MATYRQLMASHRSQEFRYLSRVAGRSTYWLIWAVCFADREASKPPRTTARCSLPTPPPRSVVRFNASMEMLGLTG